MDKMLESLENLLDEMAEASYEVEYGVCLHHPFLRASHKCPTLTPILSERCVDTQAGQQGNICDQQAAAK